MIKAGTIRRSLFIIIALYGMHALLPSYAHAAVTTSYPYKLLEIAAIEGQVPALDRRVERQRIIALALRVASVGFFALHYGLPIVYALRLHTLFSSSPSHDAASMLHHTKNSASSGKDASSLPSDDNAVSWLDLFKKWGKELFSLDTLKNTGSFVLSTGAVMITEGLLSHMAQKVDHDDDIAWFIEYHAPYKTVLDNMAAYLTVHAGSETDTMARHRHVLAEYRDIAIDTIERLIVFMEHKAKRLMPIAAKSAHDMALYTIHTTNAWSKMLQELFDQELLDYQAMTNTIEKFEQQLKVEVRRFALLEKHIMIKRLWEISL